MGLRVGGIGRGIGRAYVQPVKNRAESIPEVPGVEAKTSTQESIISALKKSQESNRKFNDVAQRFQGMTVGYGDDSSGFSYGVEGATVDLFA